MRALLVCELRRLLRTPRFLIFTVGLPLVYFLLFSGIYVPDGGPAVVGLMAMMGQVSGAGLDAGGVLVLLAWLVAVGALVIVRYRRDALRV